MVNVKVTLFYADMSTIFFMFFEVVPGAVYGGGGAVNA
jgi:hypothetical protein